MSRPVFRFAPSPNGELHLGHAYSALVSHGLARAHRGRFLLRIEDIDVTRCRPEYEPRMLDDLAWLGLVWETPVRRQSEHFETYKQSLECLEALDVLYPCFATRAEIAAAVRPDHPCDADGVPLYPGLHRGLAAEEIARRKEAGQPFALRLDMQKALTMAGGMTNMPLTFSTFDAEGRVRTEAADPARWGDAVIARKEVPSSYHLAVVVDDAMQGVTHVTRGLDLLAATDIHRLLQTLLGLPAPLYHHHRLILDANGRKLSKRHGDTSLASLRKAGATPADIRAMVGLDA